MIAKGRRNNLDLKSFAGLKYDDVFQAIIDEIEFIHSRIDKMDVITIFRSRKNGSIKVMAEEAIVLIGEGEHSPEEFQISMDAEQAKAFRDWLIQKFPLEE